jgi:putative addiction module component (TIGR02574 family)
MLKADDLIKEAISLPVELRARLVDELLKSLNPSQAEIDELWAAEAERRISEIESGKVKPIPGNQGSNLHISHSVFLVRVAGCMGSFA